MGGSILVVDDEPAVRDLLSANLQRAGYKVMTAGDVPQAEALVRDTRPDMVLLDWVLPGIPGLTFARRLRSDQRTKDISIVLLAINQAALHFFYVANEPSSLLYALRVLAFGIIIAAIVDKNLA